MAHEGLMDLALKLVQVEMELKIISIEMETADTNRFSEFHSRLTTLLERHETIAVALGAMANPAAPAVPHASDGEA